MANDTPVTIVGNLTGDPELRFTPSGAAVANFTVASTPSKYDKASGGFKDGETIFMPCSVWRQAAENAAESLQRGMRVVVTGKLESQSWENREGEKRTKLALLVEEVAPSLRYATAKVTRSERQGGGNSGGGGWSSNDGQDPWGSNNGGGQPANDPWASGATSSEEPPF